MIKKYVNRLPHAVRGILYALTKDFGFRSQFYIAIAVSILIFYFFSPLSTQEFLFLGMAAMLILITELQNSALEAALDRLHPEIHEDIRRSKDMATGAVLFAAAFAVLVIATIVFNRY